VRVDLVVPFEQKRAAQQLGACWDAARKVWFVPDGVDASLFLQWLPSVSVTKKVAKVLRRPV